MLATVIAALLIGFLAGLLSFRVKSRWCPHCGQMTATEPTALHGPGDRRV